MANKEHVQILKKGVEAWKQWRDANPLTEPELHGVSLRRAGLGGAYLGGADLRGAYFREANLRGANLVGADLRGANFREAALMWANLSGANVCGAKFADSFIAYTIFGDLDLSEAEGLEHVDHRGPSIIGLDTFYKSKGNIPETFLRGAGVPDNFIQYMHSLTGQAFEYYSCFISYSSKDQEFADRIYADLQARGVRCWLATEDLKIGDPFRQVIDDAIRRYDKLMVVLSETSVASTWVESEVEAALERERRGVSTTLFPIRLDEAVMKTDHAWAADIRRKRHMGDFSQWQDHNSYQKTFQRLLRDLQGAKGEEAKD